MSFAQTFEVALTTATGGGATGYTPTFTGPISTIRYVKSSFATGVDFAITLENTGQNVWTEANVNASATRAPRQAVHGVDGAASLYATGLPVLAPIVASVDRVKIAVTNGGNTTAGTFFVTVGG